MVVVGKTKWEVLSSAGYVFTPGSKGIECVTNNRGNPEKFMGSTYAEIISKMEVKHPEILDVYKKARLESDLQHNKVDPNIIRNLLRESSMPIRLIVGGSVKEGFNASATVYGIKILGGLSPSKQGAEDLVLVKVFKYVMPGLYSRLLMNTDVTYKGVQIDGGGDTEGFHPKLNGLRTHID